MGRSVRRLLVVLAVAGAGLVPAPATAAYCSGSGVNVVVDFGALGGGIAKDCDSSGNRNAAKAFSNTGHPLTYAQRQPGFVCRVDGAPASDPCVNTSPADAYWGLYWSDGSGGWKYASTSVGSLTIPAGGSVAFSWQNGGGDPPGVAPAAPTASQPKPSPTPTKKPRASSPTKQPTGGATTAPRSATPTASTSGSASASPSTKSSAPAGSASASAGASPSTEVSPPADATATGPTPLTTPDDDGSGLPWWVPVAVLVGLGAGGGAAWWTRRPRPT